MDNQSALADFFADADIESLREQVLVDFNIDITGVYCLHTGRLVGRFDDFVIQFAIEESDDDEDALADSLMSRVVASMRPTPMLNMPDRITLLNLAAKYPVDILCYLGNRLHGNRYLACNRSSETLAPYLGRIALHQQWSELALSGVDLRPWIHWLLELDSKCNLHDLTPIQMELDRLAKWIPTKAGKPLLHCVTPENAEELLKHFEKWAFERLGEYEERDRRATAQAAWTRGNTMAQPAFTRSWLENPEIANRKRADELKKEKAKKSRPRSEAAIAMDAKVDKFLGLLDSILDGDIPTPTPPKPKARVLTGGMLNLKRKDS
jgi:hypothetical protein